MGSQWFCKVLGQEIGPVGFPGLVEMVRSGALKEDDPVRRETATEWTPAREVIGLFRAARKKPAGAAPPGAPAAPKPAQVPPKAAAKPPAAKPRRIGKRRVLVAGGVVAVVLLAALVSAWRANRRTRFPEPQANRPRPADASLSTAARSPGRFTWDFRQGVDARNMALVPGNSHEEVRRATPDGFRCTLPPDYEGVRYCGLRLQFDLRGDFEITASYEILSLPPGVRGSHPGVKLTVGDAYEEVAMMERQHLYDGREILNAYRSWPEDGKKRYDVRAMPTDARSGRMRLQRSGSTIRFLSAIGESEEFVEMWTTEFPPNDIERIDLAAQTGGAPTGIDMVWTDLDVQADALVGIAVD